MLLFFQTVITSDSVGAGVIAQHEHHTLLSRFRHCSVTSMRSEIRRGNSWAEGSVNERCVWSKAAPAVLLQSRHIYRSISQGWPVTERSNIICYFYRTISSPHSRPARGKITELKSYFLHEYFTFWNSFKKGSIKNCSALLSAKSHIQWMFVIYRLHLSCACGFSTSGMGQEMVSLLGAQSTTECNISTTIGWIPVANLYRHLWSPEDEL